MSELDELHISYQTQLNYQKSHRIVLAFTSAVYCKKKARNETSMLRSTLQTISRLGYSKAAIYFKLAINIDCRLVVPPPTRWIATGAWLKVAFL